MQLTFHVATKNSFISSEGEPFTVVLKEDNWDDYGFKTFFTLYLFDEHGKMNELGSLRIGFAGQESGYTSAHFPKTFMKLGENFFSVGNSVEYYVAMEELPNGLGNDILSALRDIAHNPAIIPTIESESVFKASLLRNVSLTTIRSQYARVVKGGVALTEFNFCYERKQSEKYSGIYLDFKVDPESRPSSNIHILIGRNGVGKTTLLNDMVTSLLTPDPSSEEQGIFQDNEKNWFTETKSIITAHTQYFSGLISVSFSAFDPFVPPPNRDKNLEGLSYTYIGLKDQEEPAGRHKDTPELADDFLESLEECLQVEAKRQLLIDSIVYLNSDLNFAEMNLHDICVNRAFERKDSDMELAHALFKKMSSGHGIVLLTITKLVEKVEEKTLILLDEPESHLHPPLLAAFMRALSNLLDKRNGIAIIATHSPVVLQEVPRSCVSILERFRLEMSVKSPTIETFAENVGILTREVFGLEVARSGFNAILTSEVEKGKSLEKILTEYDGKIGFEGRAIIQSLINLKVSD